MNEEQIIKHLEQRYFGKTYLRDEAAFFFVQVATNGKFFHLTYCSSADCTIERLEELTIIAREISIYFGVNVTFSNNFKK